MNQNEEKTKILTWQQDIYVLAIVMLVVIISYVPNWIIRFGLLDNYVANYGNLFLFLFALQLFLMWACPLLSKRVAPEFCGFNIKWFQETPTEIMWCVLLPLVAIATSMITSVLVQQFGLPVSQPLELSRFDGSIKHLIILIFLSAFIGPAIDELFWRGFVQNCLLKVFGPELALFVQAFAWALLYFNAVGGFIIVFVLGLIFGLWQMKRKTFLPSIIGRIALNSMVIAALLICQYAAW
jgi:membrane protease YdiL (CAAX protease family)